MDNTTTMAEDTFFIDDNAATRLVACQCCGMEALQRSEGESTTCPRCGGLMSEACGSEPRALLSLSLGQKMLLVAGLVLGLALFATACGGEPASEVDDSQLVDEAALQLQLSDTDTCQVSIEALVDGQGLKGVLHRDRDDLDVSTPDVLEFEVVTGMYEGICLEQPELYVNGEPAALLASDGSRARFLAQVSASEPEVLLSAYCGRCKAGTWGTVIR